MVFIDYIVALLKPLSDGLALRRGRHWEVARSGMVARFCVHDV
jgi:hypothetical protein